MRDRRGWGGGGAAISQGVLASLGAGMIYRTVFPSEPPEGTTPTNTQILDS